MSLHPCSFRDIAMGTKVEPNFRTHRLRSTIEQKSESLHNAKSNYQLFERELTLKIDQYRDRAILGNCLLKRCRSADLQSCDEDSYLRVAPGNLCPLPGATDEVHSCSGTPHWV